MSIGSSFNIAQQAIKNSQYALNIVSNNIANLNTEGYSKQSPVFTALHGYSCYNWCSSGNNLKIGHGAELSAITRNRDQALDNYYRDQSGDAAFYNQIGSMASNIGNIMNEIQGEGGLQTAFSEFFSVVAKLNSDPTNNAYRISFAQEAVDIANQFNQMANRLINARNESLGEPGDLGSFQSSKVYLKMEELNAKFEQLAEINGQIAKSSSQTGQNGSLMDKKDMLLDEIASIIPVTITQNDNGTSNIYLGNINIIQGGEQKMRFTATQGTSYDEPVIFGIENADGTVFDSNINDLLTTGSLAALGETSSNGTLSYTSVLNDLDTLARAFAEAVNEIQTQTFTGEDGLEYTPMALKDGQLTPATEPIFEIPTPPDTFTASNIKVNQAILDDPSHIAAAAVNIDPNAAPPGYDADGIGNNLNSQRLLDLQNQKLDLLDKAGTGIGATLEDFLGSMITDIGSKISDINDKIESQGDIVDQIETQRASLFGVNLDEELADLIKYQRAYEAAARVFNVASQVMQMLTTLGQ